MSNDVNLNSFPSGRSEALAMLYLQNQDLSDKSPGEITILYLRALRGVKETLRTTKPESIRILK